jgi:hypothetical protein
MQYSRLEHTIINARFSSSLAYFPYGKTFCDPKSLYWKLFFVSSVTYLTVLKCFRLSCGDFTHNYKSTKPSQCDEITRTSQSVVEVVNKLTEDSLCKHFIINTDFSRLGNTPSVKVMTSNRHPGHQKNLQIALKWDK